MGGECDDIAGIRIKNIKTGVKPGELMKKFDFGAARHGWAGQGMARRGEAGQGLFYTAITKRGMDNE